MQKPVLAKKVSKMEQAKRMEADLQLLIQSEGLSDPTGKRLPLVNIEKSYRLISEIKKQMKSGQRLQTFSTQDISKFIEMNISEANVRDQSPES